MTTADSRKMQNALDDTLSAIDAIFQQTFPIDYFGSIPGLAKYTADLEKMQENLARWKEADKEYWENRDSA